MEQNMVLKLMRVREGAIIPKQATAGSAGYDLCACMDAPQTIEPGERCVFPSGLAAEIPAALRAELEAWLAAFDDFNGSASAAFSLAAVSASKRAFMSRTVSASSTAITAAKSRSACTISARSRTRCSRASALRK